MRIVSIFIIVDEKNQQYQNVHVVIFQKYQYTYGTQNSINNSNVSGNTK